MKLTTKQYIDQLKPACVDYSFVKLLLPLINNRPCLDIGCGAGDHLEHLGSNSIGIDVSKPNIASCRKKNIRVIRADISGVLPVKDKSFDIVMLSHILEHVDAPIDLLREAWRCLKKDGYLLVGLPVEKSLARVILRDHYFKGHPTHLYSFSFDCLKQLFKVSGFEFERIIINIPLIKRINLWPLLYLAQLFPKGIVKYFSANFWIIGVKKQPE